MFDSARYQSPDAIHVSWKILLLRGSHIMSRDPHSANCSVCTCWDGTHDSRGEFAQTAWATAVGCDPNQQIIILPNRRC
jgi:hypothetical protein